jgi:hypothetical protein
MAAAGKVTGLEKILGNLDKEIERIEGLSMDGLLEAGFKVLGVAQERTPVDTGNLKGSGFVRKEGKLSVSIGFGAAYAIYVHEDLEAKHTTGQAKFLESALRDNRDAILTILQMKARVR